MEKTNRQGHIPEKGKENARGKRKYRRSNEKEK